MSLTEYYIKDILNTFVVFLDIFNCGVLPQNNPPETLLIVVGTFFVD